MILWMDLFLADVFFELCGSGSLMEGMNCRRSFFCLVSAFDDLTIARCSEMNCLGNGRACQILSHPDAVVDSGWGLWHLLLHDLDTVLLQELCTLLTGAILVENICTEERDVSSCFHRHLSPPSLLLEAALLEH
jgi:hypothetical protein